MPQRDEWVELGNTFRSRNDGVAIMAGPVAGGLVGAGGIVGLVGVIVGTLAAAIFVAARHKTDAKPQVNLERQAFRLGKSEFPFEGITAARLIATDTRDYDERVYYGTWSEWKYLYRAVWCFHTQPYGVAMRNVQSRVIDAPAEAVGALLNDFGSDGDVLWPKPQWVEAKLDRGLQPGSTGGHGPIRYTVTEFEPGKRVRLQFDPTIGILGYHELVVAPRGEGRSKLTHIIDGRVTGRMRFLWPVAIRWAHEAVLHDLLDNAELAATGRLAAGKSRWSPWVRFLRKVAPE